MSFLETSITPFKFEKTKYDIQIGKKVTNEILENVPQPSNG